MEVKPQKACKDDRHHPIACTVAACTFADYTDATYRAMVKIAKQLKLNSPRAINECRVESRMNRYGEEGSEVANDLIYLLMSWRSVEGG